MLEYSKLILQKMTFDKALFAKELRKFLKLLEQPEEIELLKKWVYHHYYFGDFCMILDECFKGKKQLVNY